MLFSYKISLPDPLQESRNIYNCAIDKLASQHVMGSFIYFCYSLDDSLDISLMSLGGFCYMLYLIFIIYPIKIYSSCT